jgi:hypothetical protein
MKGFECFKAVVSNKRWELRFLKLKIFQTEVKVVNLSLFIRQWGTFKANTYSIGSGM